MDNCLVKEKYSYNVELDTMSDVKRFVATATACEGSLVLRSDNGFSVNAKSLIGVALAHKLNWNNLILESDRDRYSEFSKYIRE